MMESSLSIKQQQYMQFVQQRTQHTGFTFIHFRLTSDVRLDFPLIYEVHKRVNERFNVDICQETKVITTRSNNQNYN